MEVVVFAIEDILDTSDDGVQVKLAESGRACWLPRNDVQFAPGRVIVPVWLAEKIKGGRV